MNLEKLTEALESEQTELKKAQEQAQLWSHNAARSEGRIQVLEKLIAEQPAEPPE